MRPPLLTMSQLVYRVERRVSRDIALVVTMSCFKHLNSFLYVAFVLTFCFCSLRGDVSFTKATDTIALASTPSPSPRVRIDYTIAGRVPILKQPDEMSCWATVATMLVSWRDNKQYQIEEVIDRAGPQYLQVFLSGQGLDPSKKSGFLSAIGLKSEAPQSFTVEGWLSLLKNHGPLWVTTQLRRDKPEEEKFSVHARILIGLYEDAQSYELYAKVIDPESGKQYDEKFTDFVRRYENVAREDLEMETDFQPQVIHF